jgi:hypothetical protein
MMGHPSLLSTEKASVADLIEPNFYGQVTEKFTAKGRTDSKNMARASRRRELMVLWGGGVGAVGLLRGARVVV